MQKFILKNELDVLVIINHKLIKYIRFDKTFNILISGDEFQLTKTHTNLLNFCFSLVNDAHQYYKGKRKKKTEKIIEIVKETIDDIFDQNKYIIRNHDESLLLKDRQDSEQRLGYSNSPLLSFITFENIVVDILHLFLRITDRLLDILFNNLMESGFKVLN